MTQGIHPLAANMVNQLNRVDVISNNLANANTTGFKEDNLVEGSFNNYLDKAKEERKETMKLSEVMNTIPKIDGDFMDTSVGSIRQTGNRLDFALKQSELFFKVQNANGKTELTRDGSFKILDGQLVTQNGNFVLDAQNRKIDVDAGNIFAGNIGIFTTDFKNLDKIGNNNYKVTDEKELSVAINNEDSILQGGLEASNVNTINSMVTLIEAQRKFEQAQKAITGIDEIDKKVITDIGNPV